MYILTSDGKSIIDSNFVDRFCIVEKFDAILIIASYSADRAVTIGKYANYREAVDAFHGLFTCIKSGSDYEMPDSVLFHGEKWKRDARTTRKGGS